MKNKFVLYFILIATCCVSMGFYIFVSSNDGAVKIAITIFCFVIISLSFLLIVSIKNYCKSLLEHLSDMLSTILNGEKAIGISELDDNMFSKLQSQSSKLIGILNAQNINIANERDEIKSLITDISHQLKTPLSNLKLYYELLQDKTLSQENYDEFSGNMKSQIEKLSFLLESLIKMSRLESGIITLSLQNTSIDTICLTAIKQGYQISKAKNIEIKFHSDEDIFINVDFRWTSEAVFNILENSVKYTNTNGIISITVQKYELFARIDIADNGVGIPQEDFNYIFKRFYRGENAVNVDGIGIGLYLTREIIQQQNGYIKVSSKQGKGSSFSVFLPL